MSARAIVRSSPPASPLVTRQYVTSMPASVHDRDRAGGAEVDVVGVRHHHQHALDALVGRELGDLHHAEPLVEQSVEDLRVARALRRLHDLAHQEPALLLPQLVVAAAVFLDRVGVRREHRRPRARRARLRRSPARAHGRRRPARGRLPSRSPSASTSFARLRDSVPSPTSAISSASASGGNGSTAGERPGLVQVAEHLAGQPVRDVLARRARGDRRLGVVGEARALEQRPGVGLAHAPVVDEARAPRRRQLADRGPRRGAHRVGRARPARGRARGSSGSPPSPPWTACPG